MHSRVVPFGCRQARRMPGIMTVVGRKEGNVGDEAPAPGDWFAKRRGVLPEAAPSESAIELGHQKSPRKTWWSFQRGGGGGGGGGPQASRPPAVSKSRFFRCAST